MESQIKPIGFVKDRLKPNVVRFLLQKIYQNIYQVRFHESLF